MNKNKGKEMKIFQSFYLKSIRMQWTSRISLGKITPHEPGISMHSSLWDTGEYIKK